MENTQSKTKRVFYFDSSCFVDIVTLNLFMCMLYRVNHKQAKYVIRILVAALQEYGVCAGRWLLFARV